MSGCVGHAGKERWRKSRVIPRHVNLTQLSQPQRYSGYSPLRMAFFVSIARTMDASQPALTGSSHCSSHRASRDAAPANQMRHVPYRDATHVPHPFFQNKISPTSLATTGIHPASAHLAFPIVPYRLAISMSVALAKAPDAERPK
jgi:hypothetical protein